MVSRILLADDSITIQKVVNLTFADEGIEVVAVSNGEMAARRLEEVNPDLVLADIFMPGKNGYELCEAIKTNAKFRHVPVVLLVGAFEPFDQIEARRVQADAHLTKPFESRTLVETVRKLLGNTDRPHTGPLAAASPAHQESSVSFEEPDSWLTPTLVDSTATLEFESASGQWTPAETPVDAPGAQLPVPENGLVDAAQHAEETFSDFEPAQIHSSDFEIKKSWERATGELASPPSAGEAQERTVSPEYQIVSAPDSQFEVQIQAAVDRDDKPLDNKTQYLTADTPPAHAFDQQQMVVDFEESLPATPEGDTDAIVDSHVSSGEVDDGEETDSVEWQMEPVHHVNTEWTTATKVNLKTTKLEMPDLPEDLRASFENNREDTAVFSFSQEPAIAESAALFTAEEPLGDVLSDTVGNEPLTPSSVYASPLEESAMTEFTLELSPDEAAEVGQTCAAHSARVTGELVTAELPIEGQEIVEAAATEDFAAPEALEQRAETPEQWVNHELQTVTADESIPPASVSYDWTSPSAVAHSTGRLDSTIMAVEPNESSEALPHEEGSPEPAPPYEALDEPAEALLHEEGSPEPAPPYEALDEPVNWGAEQMRFAAIDMEASSIGEDAGQLPSLHSSEPERGFEITAAIIEDSAAGASENGHREAAELPLQPIELSPMVIDEIVRRVVSQIGDSVVREIAWEIIPDCVERIIEQQTRDALAKR